MFKRLAAATLLLAHAALAASAKDAKIGVASLTLTAPPGHCELDESNPSDARLVGAIQGMLAGTNRLLAAYADCRQLADWRTGKRPFLDDMAQYQTPIAAMDAPPPEAPAEALKQICASYRAEGEKLTEGLVPDIRSRAAQVMKEVKFNEMRFLGVVAEEPAACFAAMLQKLRTETGTEKTQIALYATTFVHGKVVFYYVFSPHVNDETLPTMLAKHKANVAALRAANE